MLEEFINRKQGILDDKTTKQLRMEWLEFCPDTTIRSAVRFNDMLAMYGYGIKYAKMDGKTVRVYAKDAAMPIRTERVTCWCGHSHRHVSEYRT